MSDKSYKLADVNVPWVFVPLNDNDILRAHLWIKRWYTTPEVDRALAIDYEKAILAAFNELGLQYNTDAFGEVKVDNIRLYLGADGIALPETCFIVVPPEIKRIENPLRPLQDE